MYDFMPTLLTRPSEMELKIYSRRSLKILRHFQLPRCYRAVRIALANIEIFEMNYNTFLSYSQFLDEGRFRILPKINQRHDFHRKFSEEIEFAIRFDLECNRKPSFCFCKKWILQKLMGQKKVFRH